MSGMTARCERAVGESQLWYDYVCMLACVYGVYLIVGIIVSGSFDTEVYVWVYIYGGIQLQPKAQIYIFAYISVGLGCNEILVQVH